MLHRHIKINKSPRRPIMTSQTQYFSNICKLIKKGKTIFTPVAVSHCPLSPDVLN